MGERQCAKCNFWKPEAAFAKVKARYRRGTCNRCRTGKSPAPHFEGYASRGEGVVVIPKFHRVLDSKRYIITSAQNATPVHEACFETLKVAAQHLHAELVVIPMRYKNPTSIWSSAQERDDWWDSETVPFLFNQRKKLHPHLALVADVKTQPTAISPLSGFEALTGPESCIIGHAKMEFLPVPVPSGRFPKILTTTGACTLPNYTDTGTGKKGEFNHFLGALMVEVVGKRFHLRQLNADKTDGSFIDLDTLYTAEGVRPAPRALGLVLGDAHAKFFDKGVEHATFGPGGMVEVLDPEVLIWHDTTDGYAVNPHHRGNPFVAQAKHKGGFPSAGEEVRHAIEFVAARTKGRKSVIVASNHDDFLARWLATADWRLDPRNAEFYLESALMMVRSAALTAGGARYADPFRYWVNALKGDAEIRCLGQDESFTLAGIELGLHGDKGPNGARATMDNIARLGVKTIDAHGHTPGIKRGHYRVGTSTPLRLEYNGGPSSWLNTHCAIYGNGKRALLTVIDGEWRA